MKQVFRCEYRVSYAHCTIGNHVYHSRYLDILEFARGEFHRHVSPTQLELQQSGFAFPVVHVELRYLAPARYDDLLTVELWLSLLTRIRIHYACRILRAGTLLVSGETRHVCTDLHEKPRRMPDELLSALQPFLAPETPPSR